MKKEDFRRLKLSKRYKLVQEQGTYLAKRIHGGFLIHLYDFHGYYVEVWKPAGINLIQWIEVVNRDEILDSYLQDFDIGS
ncbi:MAG: hypothetical protein CMP59_04950 [Flavobacteriales bacterium]|nr:hypothetical protein [Flavobacteriales bacterium]|tara:strand:- start:1 stop:240 length:240 start_codon:yes stop_codon:yes gene_type:complete